MSKVVIAWSSNKLIDQYNDTNSGHFFDKDTMRFFKSRITSSYRRIDDNTALFITTERFSMETTRLATVRIAKLITYWREDGRECYKIDISTLGEFNRLTMYQAKKAMKEYKGE